MFLSKKKMVVVVLASAAAIFQMVHAGPRSASSAALDSGADITDLYAFRSWKDPSKVVFILNVIGGQDPAHGPGYYNFDDTVRYRINIDNDMDGIANDVIYEFRFASESRAAYGELTFPLFYVGNPLIQSRPELRGISALDGAGSEGITFRQTYGVLEKRSHQSNEVLFSGSQLVAVPSYVGPVTMPNYEQLAAQGVYFDEDKGIKVFAGQRADAFFADTGALFDGAAPRRFPPLLSPEEEASNSTNPFGVNAYAGKNVHSIVIEVPIDRIVNRHFNSNELPYIGVYASSGRMEKKHSHRWWPRKERLDASSGRMEKKHSHRWWPRKERFDQVSRMGNAMVQTLVIDIPNKGKYKTSRPQRDEKYALSLC